MSRCEGVKLQKVPLSQLLRQDLCIYNENTITLSTNRDTQPYLLKIDPTQLAP